MIAVNEKDFSDLISRRLARGESPSGPIELWLDSIGREKASIEISNGGMIDPVRYEIKAGTTLYRFASVSDGVEGAMSGGWWLERRELDQLIRYAEINNKSLGYAVRLLCCVPPEWGSALNFLIAVKTVSLVAAWRGLANSAREDYKIKPGMSKMAAGRTNIIAQNDIAALRVPQLFIPGTRKLGVKHAFFSFQGQWQTEGAKDWIFGSGAQ